MRSHENKTLLHGCLARTYAHIWLELHRGQADHMSVLGMQLDLSEGIEAAVPGWADIRLLAPHAELRLLACGQGTLIDASRLRCRPEPASYRVCCGTHHAINRGTGSFPHPALPQQPRGHRGRNL